MAIFAEGLGFQTYTITNGGSAQVFYGLGQGGTAITGSGTANILRNPTVFNAGTSTIYVGGGSTVSVATGFPLAPGQQLLIMTEPGTAASLMPAIWAIIGSGTNAVIYSGLATQALVD
jgi:hypothetical protein